MGTRLGKLASIIVLCLSGYLAARFVLAMVLPDNLIVLGPTHINVIHDDSTKPLDAIFLLHNPTSHPINIKAVQVFCACIVSHIGQNSLGPNETVPLNLTINSFKTFGHSFQQKAIVVPECGKNIELVIGGELTEFDKVLFRPSTLYIRSCNNFPLVREIIVRVPKNIENEVTLKELAVPTCKKASGTVSEKSGSEYYREFVVSINFPAKPSKQTSDGYLTIDGVAFQLNIPVITEFDENL